MKNPVFARIPLSHSYISAKIVNEREYEYSAGNALEERGSRREKNFGIIANINIVLHIPHYHYLGFNF